MVKIDLVMVYANEALYALLQEVLLNVIVNQNNTNLIQISLQVLDMIENQNYRLEMPRNCPHSIYDLMLTCWSLEPASRPTFARLHQAFSENPEYNDISSHRDLYQCPGDL